MIREEVLTDPYPRARLIESEWAAIEVALVPWIAANIYQNRDDKEADKKSQFPQHASASAVLEKYGIKWGYKRGQVRFCHIEYELRLKAAEILFDVDKPRRDDVRERVRKFLRKLGYTNYEL